MKTGQLGRNPIQDKLRELFSELSSYTTEKKGKLAEIENITAQMTQVNNELKKQFKNVHPTYNKEELIEKGIKELSRSLQTYGWKP